MQYGSWIYVIYSQVEKHYDSDFLTVSLVTGKYLYLSDWVMRVIERVNIDFSSDREILLAGALDFVDLKAVTIKKKKSKHQKKAILWNPQSWCWDQLNMDFMGHLLLEIIKSLQKHFKVLDFLIFWMKQISYP